MSPTTSPTAPTLSTESASVLAAIQRFRATALLVAEKITLGSIPQSNASRDWSRIMRRAAPEAFMAFEVWQAGLRSFATDICINVGTGSEVRCLIRQGEPDRAGKCLHNMADVLAAQYPIGNTDPRVMAAFACTISWFRDVGYILQAEGDASVVSTYPAPGIVYVPDALWDWPLANYPCDSPNTAPLIEMVVAVASRYEQPYRELLRKPDRILSALRTTDIDAEGMRPALIALAWCSAKHAFWLAHDVGAEVERLKRMSIDCNLSDII